MSEKYRPGDNEIAHFVTFSVVEWIDALTRNEYKDLILKSLIYCRQHKGLNIHAWIIMSNHVHLIISCRRGFELSDALRDFKKYTSKKIYAAIKSNPRESRKEWMIYLFDRAGKRNANNTNFQFWQQKNHYEELFTPQMLKEKLDYLHSNPVKAGVVREPQHYVYSSAVDYFTDQKGMIETDHLQVW